MKPLTKKGMTILEAIIGMTVLIVITISVINLSLSATKASNAVGMNPRMNTVRLTLVSTNVTSNVTS